MKTAALLSPPQLPLQPLSAITNTTLSITSHPVPKAAFDATAFFRGKVLTWVYGFLSNEHSSVQLLSGVQVFATP